MLLPWQTGKVIRIEDETASTRRFWIETESPAPFDFKPGQFVTLDLPIHEQKNKRWRSYSIASWPDGTNVFELVIVLLEGGAGTKYLFSIGIGSELTFRGPLGVFLLPPSIEQDLFFICTGTGIAPFRSMAHHILQNNVPHKDIYLVFGCRKIGDCLYGREMKDLELQVPSFHYIPTFSREDEHDHLIRRGYVHDVYEEICSIQKKESGVDLHPAKFYLCGWKNMIDEARQRILAMGYDKKDIHLELYG